MISMLILVLSSRIGSLKSKEVNEVLALRLFDNSSNYKINSFSVWYSVKNKMKNKMKDKIKKKKKSNEQNKTSHI